MANIGHYTKSKWPSMLILTYIITTIINNFAYTGIRDFYKSNSGNNYNNDDITMVQS